MILFFLDLSMGELLLIFFAFLILFGPESIPKLAQTLGRFIFELRRMRENVTQEIFQSTQQVQNYIHNTRKEIEKNIESSDKNQENLAQKSEVDQNNL